MDGGIDSGFRQIKEDTDIILYQIKGKRRPVLQQVPPTGESLNQGDAFILQTPKKFFLWVGQKANLMEKNKAASVLDLLLSKRPKALKERLDNGETTPEFWQFLGGEKPIKDAAAGGEDAEFEASNVRVIYRFDKPAKIAEGAAATKDKLTSDGVYVIVRGQNAVLYQGQKADPAFCKKALVDIAKFFTDNGLPPYIPVSIAKEGITSETLELIFA